jgi:hypothetical protein
MLAAPTRARRGACSSFGGKPDETLDGQLQSESQSKETALDRQHTSYLAFVSVQVGQRPAITTPMVMMRAKIEEECFIFDLASNSIGDGT